MSIQYAGFIDSIKFNQITGWALCKNKPNKSVHVELRVNNVIITTVKANLFRIDLKEKGISKGKNGFSIKIDNDYCGEDIEISIRGTEFILPKNISLDNKTICILLARQRSGTNVLRRCLNTNPDIKAYNELFDLTPAFKKEFTGSYSELINNGESELHGVFRSYHDYLKSHTDTLISPADAFTKLVQCIKTFSPKKHSVIDIKYNHIINIHNYIHELLTPPCLFGIIKNNDWFVFNLQRKNYLKVIVSGIVASRTGRYVIDRNITNNDNIKHDKINIDCDSLFRIMSKYKEQDKYIENQFHSYHKYFKYEYEDMFDNENFSTIFLDEFSSFQLCQNNFNIIPQTKKIVKKTLPSLIINYEEVCKTLKGTIFEYCIE